MPVSLIGTFAFFPVLGFSINTLSLFGLVLAIGLVVDDAIVVVEAVEHHIEEGMAPREATIQAMNEVSGPGRRHRTDSRGRIYSHGFHERHSGTVEQTIRRHRRDFRSHLGLQRSHAFARARGHVASPA